MKTSNYSHLTTPDLIKEFVHLAKTRGLAIVDFETRRANRMFDRMRDIDLILRSRGIEARMSLAPLLADSDRFVRYYAAKYLLGLVPGEARAVIEEIAKYKYDALCGDAGMCLYALDAGIFKPD